jgi:hypothetical protein
MKHLKTFESIDTNHDYMINDIKDILIDFNDVDVDLVNKIIIIIRWGERILTWDEDIKLTFVMLNNYLNDNLEADKVLFYRDDIHGRFALSFDGFLDYMDDGEVITNLLITLL